MTKKKSKNGENNLRKTHTRKKMKGGAGQSIIFELKDGKFYGYGAEEQEGS